MLVAAEKSNVDMSDFGKNVIPTISSLVKVSMLMNLMATGKTLVRLSHFGKLIWSTFHQKTPWIVAIVSGKFTLET